MITRLKERIKALAPARALRAWEVNRVRAGYLLRYGLRYLWPRFVTSREILRYPPLPLDAQGPVELHLLTCRRDIVPACWSLYSWYHFTGRRDPLCIHDDGSIDAAGRAALLRLFPGARFIARAEADAAMAERLAGHPNCRRFRATGILSLKVFDFCHFARAPRILIMDSDQAFFGRPAEVLEQLDQPVTGDTPALFTQDFQNSYSVPRFKAREATGFELPERLNSGLGLVATDRLDLDFAERVLAIPEMWDKLYWAEQTLWALLVARHGVHLLGAAYQVPQREQAGLDGLVLKHYVGFSHRLFFVEAVPALRAHFRASPGRAPSS